MRSLRHLETVEMLADIVSVPCLRVPGSQYTAREPQFRPMRVEVADYQSIIGFQEVPERELKSTYFDSLKVDVRDVLNCVALPEEEIACLQVESKGFPERLRRGDVKDSHWTACEGC